MSATSGMQYFGMIVDLDEFDGPVIIQNSNIENIGPRYNSCKTSQALNSGPVYNAALDDTPSYGQKTKYQIKSLISIVNHKGTVDIVKNIFFRNGGTKGIIYLDMKHRTNARRAFIVNNEFTENSGLIESSVIFIRAHAPLERGSVYSRVPYDTGNTLIPPLGT